MPVFIGADLQVHHVAYTPICAIAHLGTVVNGHYQIGVKFGLGKPHNGHMWMLIDDRCIPTPFEMDSSKGAELLESFAQKITQFWMCRSELLDCRAPFPKLEQSLRFMYFCNNDGAGSHFGS